MDLSWIRSFTAIAEEGSFNRAALRLGVSQPTVTRRMRALEGVVGGRLFDRGPAGVKLTDAGEAFARHAPGILQAADRGISETRRLALGERDRLRIGYLLSAAQDFLDPALLALRQKHPGVRVELKELSPGEQIAWLRRGDLDVALVGQEGSVLGKDYYTHCLGAFEAVAVLPADHPLAERGPIALRDLRGETFVACPDEEMPGRNEWIIAQCRRVGFRPRFGPVGDSLAHLFSLVVSEPAVSLAPAYVRALQHPGVRLVPLKDARAGWRLLVVWHRGRASAPLKTLLAGLRKPGVAGK